MSEDKIPVTILTGFLGAGKTTLLNRLIADNPDKKFAIIENEFGDIGIDQELVVNAEEGIFELTNGCVCCSLNAEFGELLQRLVSSDYKFNHLIIETTGIAEPDGIASNFIGNNRSTKFVLDGTICLADAHDININLKERGEAQKQLSFADVIVLNKRDRVSEDELETSIKAIRDYNSTAPIYHGSYGKITANLLNIQAYDSQRLENNLMNPSHRHDHHQDLVAHSFELDQPLDPHRFEHWITMLLFLSGYQVYRIKGVLNLRGESNKVIFQSVRSNSRLDVGSPWRSGEIRKTRIVFIGSNIQREPLDKGLKGCLK